MSRGFALLLAALALVGCDDDSMDPDGGGADAGPRSADAGPVSCDPGQHVCGGGCVDDLPNEPENGCRRGCGDACDVPPGGVATCSGDGECTLGCDPPFVLMDDTCVCEPRTCDDLNATCGAPDDGCGTPLDCGTCEGGRACVMNTCGCAPDDNEPNDDPMALAMHVADIPDEDWNMTFESWNMDTADDVDWYSFDVTDTGFTNPSIRVTLDMIPAGSNYDVAAFYVCDEGGDVSSCTSGAPDSTLGAGCFANAVGTTPDTAGLDADCDRTLSNDDNGTLFVRVTADRYAGSCDPYRLRIDVTN